MNLKDTILRVRAGPSYTQLIHNKNASAEASWYWCVCVVCRIVLRMRTLLDTCVFIIGAKIFNFITLRKFIEWDIMFFNKNGFSLILFEIFVPLLIWIMVIFYLKYVSLIKKVGVIDLQNTWYKITIKSYNAHLHKRKTRDFLWYLEVVIKYFFNMNDWWTFWKLWFLLSRVL